MTGLGEADAVLAQQVLELARLEWGAGLVQDALVSCAEVVERADRPAGRT